VNGRAASEFARFAALGAALGGLGLCLPREIPAALAVACALALPGLAWITLRAPREEARALLPIFLAAVGVRIAVAIGIAYGPSPEYFSLDHGRYQLVGRELAEHWAGRGGSPALLTAEQGYYVWNALVYSLVGYVPLAATLSNAAVAGLSVILTWRIAFELGGASAARCAAWLAACFPSLVLWSSLNLKDACTILCILALLRGAQRLRRGFSPGALAQLAGGLAALSQLRDYLVVIALLAAGLAVLLPRLRGAVVRSGFAAAVVVAALVGAVPEPIEEFAEEASFAALDQHRRNLALGESAYHAEADVSTPERALRFLPVGLAYFLFAPAPWQLWNARQWITLPEMLIWYALVPWVCLGLRQVLRERAGAALAPAAFALLATLSYALVESNLGTAYRHRAQVLILFLIFAGVGIARRRHELAGGRALAGAAA
jgi:4-amino-4-deoxy-L-arabinose transferase-like glycosyltransferase